MNLTAIAAKVLLRLLLPACLLMTSSACYYRGEPVPPAVMREPLPIPVELTTIVGDRQTFTEGDEIQFLLSLGSDAYVYMYHVDGNGVITQLLPSTRQQGHFYAAGYFMTLPEYDDGYRFIVTTPLGEQSVWVLASDKDVSVQGQTIGELRSRIRKASDEYGEAQLSLRTVGRE